MNTISALQLPWPRLLCLPIALVCAVGSLAVPDRLSAGNPMLDRLIKNGIDLGDKVDRRLPPPTLPDGLTAAEQKSRITEILPRRVTWDKFIDDNMNAPPSIRIESVMGSDGRRIGQSFEFWFVAYGSLGAFEDEQLSKNMLEPSQDSTSSFESKGYQIDDQVLAQVGITRLADPELEEGFAYSEFPLLNKVFLRGVGHGVTSKSGESIEMAWEMDPRFVSDENLKNQWQPILIESGRKSLGPPKEYHGYGGYLKVTPLAGIDRGLFVECHILFHEPETWFNGKNVLRPKMPTVINEAVKKFRRNLKSAN